MKRILTFFLLAALTVAGADAKIYKLTSPDRKTEVTVDAGRQIVWSVTHQGKEVLAPSAVSMTVDGKIIGQEAKVKSARTEKVKQTVSSPLWRQASLTESYNQLTLELGDGWGLTFRAYDGEGVGYRFWSTSVKKGACVTAECAEFNFSRDYTTYVPYSTGTQNPYATSFENQYTVAPLSAFHPDQPAFTPLLVCLDGGLRLEITDSDIEAYPGMFLRKGPGLSLKGDFAPVPEKVHETATRGQVFVDEYSGKLAVIRENASKKAPRYFPWRLLAIAGKDADLPVNNLVWLTASPSRVKDISWIKPGKVAWDWWNNTNISGVDFKSGMNTDTYLYYIDFAAKNNIEYIIIDEGWSGKESLMENLSPEIDLKRLIAYGREKGVGIILWSSWRNLIGSNPLNDIAITDAVMKHYADMGVKGFKVDFFDRDDQQVIASAYKIAESAAKYHLYLDYHGLKPFGFQRAYPNIFNFEGVKGLENSKWEPRAGDGPLHNQPRYDVIAPYLRMLAGPMDYTPGAMTNAMKNNFFGNNDHPMSQGTRVHQMAMYTTFEAPLQMLADSPYAIYAESGVYRLHCPGAHDFRRDHRPRRTVGRIHRHSPS